MSKKIGKFLSLSFSFPLISHFFSGLQDDYVPYKTFQQILTLEKKKNVYDKNATRNQNSTDIADRVLQLGSHSNNSNMIGNALGPYVNAATGSVPEQLHVQNPNGRYQRNLSRGFSFLSFSVHFKIDYQ